MFNVSDVVLDTFPFGGGVTSLQTLAMGAPLVTLPSRFLRGRLTLALYRQMGCTLRDADFSGGADDTEVDPDPGSDPDSYCRCVAVNEQEYVERALAIGRNTTLRDAVARQIEAASPRLFEDRAAVVEWERFLTEAGRVSRSKERRRQFADSVHAPAGVGVDYGSADNTVGTGTGGVAEPITSRYVEASGSTGISKQVDKNVAGGVQRSNEAVYEYDADPEPVFLTSTP